MPGSSDLDTYAAVMLSDQELSIKKAEEKGFGMRYIVTNKYVTIN